MRTCVTFTWRGSTISAANGSLALQHWQWLSARTPEAVEPKLQIGRALFRLERHDEARSAFEAVLTLQEDHPEALRRLEVLQDPASIRWRGRLQVRDCAGRNGCFDGGGARQSSRTRRPTFLLPGTGRIPRDRIGQCGDRGDGGQSDNGGCAGGVSSPGLRPCGSIVPAGVGRGGR